MKTYSAYIIFFLFVFLFVAPSYASAKIWINEFSSNGSDDWIELYNDNDESISLEVLSIRDGSATNKLDLTGDIDGKGYVDFEWGTKLNNSGDTIKLIFKDNESSVQDEVTYGSPGDVGVPASGESAGRKTNGGTSWVLFSNSSKGSSNADAPIAPTATSVPINTPTPTKIPTPTKTPIPKKDPTFQTKITNTELEDEDSEFTATGSKAVSGKLTAEEESKISGVPTSILGMATNSANRKPPPQVKKYPNGNVMVKSANNFPYIIATIGGMFCLACGILIFLKLRKKKRGL